MPNVVFPDGSAAPLMAPKQQPPSSSSLVSQNERLVQLLVKGLLYESCVEYCQARATSSTPAVDDATYQAPLSGDPGALLAHTQLSETDASLLSWLHALPGDTFACAFEEKPLKLHMSEFLEHFKFRFLPLKMIARLLF